MTEAEKEKIIAAKKALCRNEFVIYDRIKYRLEALILRRIESEFVYYVEMQDLKANSIRCAKLKDITLTGEWQ